MRGGGGCDRVTVRERGREIEGLEREVKRETEGEDGEGKRRKRDVKRERRGSERGDKRERKTREEERLFVWCLNGQPLGYLADGSQDNFTCCHIATERGDHDLCLSRAQPIGSGRCEQGSNTRHPEQESRTLPIELSRSTD